MIHVYLRILVWVLVFGIGYLVFGPELWDSSGKTDPFASDKPVYLPPVRPARLIELERALQQRELTLTEMADYQTLTRDRHSGFWAEHGATVQSALAGIKQQRRQHLVGLLRERGMSDQEMAIFLTVLERDHAALLQDRE